MNDTPRPLRPRVLPRAAALGFALALSLVLGPTLAAQAQPAPRSPFQARLDLFVLAASYPGVIAKVETRADKSIWLTLAGEAAVPYDLGRDRPAAAYLDDPDLRESLLEAYPLEPARPHPAPDVSPGRARSQAWYGALFGATEAQVRTGLTQVSVMGAPVSLTERQGVASALRKAAQAIEEAQGRDPALRGFVLPLGGGFAWRTIAGETRLSPHSYGTAIDFNIKRGVYWRWVKPGFDIDAARAGYSQTLVRLMEAQGFIWGGKWDAFDLMHFEYRPDLLLKARLLAARPGAATLAELAPTEQRALAAKLDAYAFAPGSSLSF